MHANAIKSICLLSSPFCSPTSVTSFSSPNSPSIKLSPTSTTTNQQLAGHEGSIIREGKPSPSLSLSRSNQTTGNRLVRNRFIYYEFVAQHHRFCRPACSRTGPGYEIRFEQRGFVVDRFSSLPNLLSRSSSPPLKSSPLIPELMLSRYWFICDEVREYWNYSSRFY